MTPLPVRRFFGLALATGFAALAITLPAHAAEGAQITLSPTSTKLEHVLKPSSSYEGSFKILNSGTEAVDVSVYAKPYAVQNKAYNPTFDVQNNYNQIARWVTFEQKSYHINTNETAIINYQITTPASLPAGGQYAVLMAEVSNKPGNTGGAQIKTKSRVGMKLSARTDGKTTLDGHVTLPSPATFTIGEQQKLSATFHNKGNIDSDASYGVKVTNAFGGAKVFEKSLKASVLPDTERELTIDWHNTGTIGLYKVEITGSLAGKTETVHKTVLALTTTGLIALGILLAIIIGGIIHVIRRQRPSTTLRGRR